MIQILTSTQHALDRLTAARPFERASRMRELLVACVALQEETEALHAWLVRAWDRLDAEPDRKDFVKCENKLLSEIQRYTEMQNLLGRALKAIGKERQ